MSPRWQPLPGEVPEPRRIGESLGSVTRAMGIDRDLLVAWPSLVGEAIAAHARPRSLRDGTLTVAVDDPAWATQLRWLEADLLVRLGEVTGDGRVARIEVRVRGNVTPGW